jgi:hypothetical protein
MSIDRSTFASLDTRMAAFTPVTPTAWPNDGFTPGSVAWLRVSHLPASPVRRSIGTSGQNAYPGIYQVMVNAPAGPGPGAAETLADAVANWFPLGSVYGAVRIAAVSTQFVSSDAAWYQIAVSITYETISAS